MKNSLNLRIIGLLFCLLLVPLAAAVGQNVLSVNGEQILFNGKEIKLIGLRCSNALISDAATDDLIKALDLYQGYGLNSLSVFVMGSRFGDVKGYLPDGSLSPIHRDRLERILIETDRRKMVAVVGCLYWGTSAAKDDLSGWTHETANLAIANTARWLREKNFRHVILDPDNEGMAGREMNWKTEPLIRAAKAANPGLIVANNTRKQTTSEDLNMHFGRKKEGKPWLDSESHPAGDSVPANGYWGPFSKETHTKDKAYHNYSRIGRYTAEMKQSQFAITKDLISKHSGILFSSTWLQCGSALGVNGPFANPGGRSKLGSGADKQAAWNQQIDTLHPDAGILWWLEFVKENFQQDSARIPTKGAQKLPQSPAPAANRILLVTSQDLAPAWQQFADWKTRLGKPTTIVTTAAIDKTVEGPDLQEKIRRRVRAGIASEGIRWVILGGDSQPGGTGHLPDRDTVHNTRWGKSTDIPTDIYFLGKGNWDADGDGDYGEWKDDREAIDYPDGSIGLGRIPVRTREDVAAYTAKVIAHESNYPATGFARSFTYTCPEPGAYPKLKTSWNSVVSKAWDGGQAQWFLTGQVSMAESQATDYPLSPANWLKLINSRSTSKLHMHGHGLLDCWILENHRKLGDKQLGQLENENAYPAITTVSCFTGQFDAARDPSIAEDILRRPKAGAILVVCPSREGKPHFLDPARDFRLMMTEGKMDGTTGTMAGFWKHSLGKDRKSSGEALMTVKAALADKAASNASFHLCLCELNLLGDPTLDLRAGNPKSPVVKFPATVSPGEQELEIQSDTPAATICLWKGSEVYQTAITDASGNCRLSVNPSTPGTILVSASGPGLNAFTGGITVRKE